MIKSDSPNLNSTKDVLLKIFTTSRELLEKLAPNGFDKVYFQDFFNISLVRNYYFYFKDWRATKSDLSTLISREDFTKNTLDIVNSTSPYSINLLYKGFMKINRIGTITSSDRRKFLFNSDKTIDRIITEILFEHQLIEKLPEPYLRDSPRPLCSCSLSSTIDLAIIFEHIFSIFKADNLNWKYDDDQLKFMLMHRKNAPSYKDDRSDDEKYLDQLEHSLSIEKEGLDPEKYPLTEYSFKELTFDELFVELIKDDPKPEVIAYMKVYGQLPKGYPVKKEDYEVYR